MNALGTTVAMMGPLLPPGFVFLPQPISIGLMIVLLIFGISEARKGYIGRPAIVANVFLLWQILLPSWYALPPSIQFWGNAGVAVAVIAALSYLLGESLPTEFYDMAYWAYGSLSILIAAVVLFG